MKNITDVDRVTRGARLGKFATLGGLAFLTAGLVVSLVLQNSPLVWLSFLCLVVGLAFSTVGTMNMNRWVREPRADQALAQGLKGFDDRYRLYNYLLPAPHVLLSPMGLHVLTAMGQDGVIRYEGNRFRRDFSVGRALRFLVDEGLGKPFAEADSQVAAMQKLLEAKGVAEGVEIQNVVVFYHPRVQLDMADPPRPVVVPKGLKKALRKQGASPFTAEQHRRLQELFEGGAD
jgi:hypothetical protein